MFVWLRTRSIFDSMVTWGANDLRGFNWSIQSEVMSTHVEQFPKDDYVGHGNCFRKNVGHFVSQARRNRGHQLNKIAK